MILLQYKTTKRGAISVKVFINQYFAESWVVSQENTLAWWSYSSITKFLTVHGEFVVEFVESERTY